MYYVVYGLLYVFSLLPLRVLFVFSDLAYIILYHLINYRKKVVQYNLSVAFPDKSEEERIAIAKKFYRNLADSFIETIKLISADSTFVNKHFEADYSVFEQVFRSGKKSHIHSGHNFNWEFANLALASNIPQKLLTVYMPIENKIMNRLFLAIRAKTGAALLPATNIRTSILPWRKEQYALGLVADQKPAWPDNAYWINFFGRPTAFVRAPENGARTANLPVIFSHFTKTKRGFYRGYFSLAEENPATLEKGALTVKYVRYLEQVIKDHPDMWLWSHRRWKWDWKPAYGAIIN